MGTQGPRMVISKSNQVRAGGQSYLSNSSVGKQHVALSLGVAISGIAGRTNGVSIHGTRAWHCLAKLSMSFMIVYHGGLCVTVSGISIARTLAR